VNRPLFALVVGVLLAASSGWALETDQYYTWGRPLADSTDAINARFNLELRRALADFPPERPPERCVEISIRYRKRLRFVLFHSIQVWAMNSSLVDRIPADTDEHRQYRRNNLYSSHPFIDVGTWMPFTPTIEVDGVRMGTDKLSHLVSSGWTYYSVYRKAVSDGVEPADAERSAVRRGILEESLILGGRTSGVNSIADIEASFAGLFFYRDLCDSEDPILQHQNDGWVVIRPVDLRDYVGPRWDESYQPPVFNAKRWQKVLPVLESYCDRLERPQVVEMRTRYRARDRETVVGEVVAGLVAEGKLEDPSQFTIEAVCGEEVVSAASPAPDEGSGLRPQPPDDHELSMTERVIVEENERHRRGLGLFGLQITYPQILAVSLGVMATSQPTTYDCRMLCDFWGPFAQIEPGLGGGKLSLGWGRAMGSTSQQDTFLSRVYLALAGKLTLYRTWNDIGPLDSGRTFAGAELEFSVARVNFGLGLLYEVNGADRGRWLVTGGLGWGF
jgi:hypothetical protein